MRIVDLKGLKFGRLLVLDRLGASRAGSKLWECRCDCGNLVQISTRHLNRLNNNVRSCGCLKIEKRGSKVSGFKGYGELTGAWWTQRVLRRFTTRIKLEITINPEYAWNLFILQEKKCKFTNLDLKLGLDTSCTASLDRIDSSKGYIEGNVQWVHKDINKMKNVYDQDYFINLCKLVATNT